MGRANLVDASMDVGPLGVGAGVGFDTGATFTSSGVEMKLLGVGFTIQDEKLELCMVFCGSISPSKIGSFFRDLFG